MEPAVGHSLQLTLRLRAPLWHVGAGWAALGGAVAAGALVRDPAVPLPPPLGGLLTLALVWLLADLLLGTMWEVGAGRAGVWMRHWPVAAHAAGQPVHWLPYSQPGSPALRLAAHFSAHRSGERPQPDRPDVSSLSTWLGALTLALMIAAPVGYVAIALVIAAASLSWLAARLADSRRMDSTGSSSTGLSVVHALSVFGIPWLIGYTVGGAGSWEAILLGVCLTIVWAGFLQDLPHLRLIVAGQLAMVSLLLGLHQPLAAATAGVALVAQWAVARSTARRSPHWLRQAVQPFLLVGLIAAAVAVGT